MRPVVKIGGLPWCGKAAGDGDSSKIMTARQFRSEYYPPVTYTACAS